MTYGEYLRYCRTLAGSPTKTDFARMLEMKVGDHYIGAENDTWNKKPSLDLLERAAKKVGLEFSDFIQEPPKLKKELSPKHKSLIRKCEALLLAGGEPELWFEANIVTFYKAYFHRR